MGTAGYGKRGFLILLVAVLVFAFACAALADSPKFNSTKDFLEYLDENDVKYSFLGMNDDQKFEQVQVNYSGDNVDEIHLMIFFHKDEDQAAVRCWNLVTVPQENLDEAYRMVNAKNLEYRWVSFTLDTQDNTIQAEADVGFRSRDVGAICHDMISRVVAIVDECYPDLQTLEK